MTGEVTGGETAHDAALGRSRPWSRRIVAVAWVALLLAATGAFLGNVWLGAGEAVAYQGTFGFGFRTGLDGVVPYSKEAIDSGLRAGDSVIAVDGVSISERQPRVPEMGEAAIVTVRSLDGSVSDHRLTRSVAHAEQLFSGSGISPSAWSWFMLTTAAAGNLVLIVAAFLLFVRGRDRRMPTLLSFAFLLIAASLLNYPVFDYLDLSEWRFRVLVTGWTVFILAMLQFPQGHFAWRWQRWFAWFVVIATAAVLAAPTGFWGTWSMFHTGLLLVAAGSLIGRYRRLTPGPERQQVRWALFGFIAGSVVLAPVLYLDVMVLPADLGTRVFVWSTLVEQTMIVIILGLIAGGLLVSLVRYRLYDADAVISRSVSIGALTLALLAVFAGTEKVIELLGEEWFGESLGVLAGGIGAAVAAVMIVPLHHRLTHWAEHKFQKQLIRLRTGLPLLVGDMRETAPVARIAAATLDSVTHGVRASRVALVFEGDLLDARGIDADEVANWRSGWIPAPHNGFDVDKADATFPLRVPLAAGGHGRIGWLLLGPRPDGSFYGKDERETLEQIADPVARALEIAQARETREAAERERWRGQDSLNAEIKAVNTELVRVLGALDAKLGQLLPAPPAAAARRAKQRAAGKPRLGT